MNRKEIIAQIEQLLEHPENAQLRDEFTRRNEELTKKDQNNREFLNADFQRALAFLFLLMIPDRRLPSYQREFLRPTRRSMLMWLAMMCLLVGEFYACSMFGSSGRVVFVFVLVIEFFLAVWVITKIQPRTEIDSIGMKKRCIQCEHELAGLNSVLGDQLWVGPVICPECGQDYPAIPE